MMEYLDYLKMAQKTHVMNFIMDWFEKLDFGSLINNIGLLLKSMYEDNEYMNRAKKLEAAEVKYKKVGKKERHIKIAIDTAANGARYPRP